MKRREFVKSLCGAGFCSATMLVGGQALSGCKSFASKPTGEQAKLEGNRLVIEKIRFDAAENASVVINHNDQQISVTRYQTNQNEARYTALLLTCTHMGCAISAKDETTVAIDDESTQFICPCHGARFTRTGRVLKGPATKDLTSFITSQDASFIYIHLT